MAKMLRMVMLFMLLWPLAGCWDRIEIEERGFVVGTALDAAEDGQIKLTFQIVVPTQMKGSSGQKNEGGSPFINLSSTADSVFKAARKMSNEISRSPYLAHNQVIIISEKLVETEHVGDVLDLFIRDPENRRASNIMVAHGEASKILEVHSKIETLPAQYIRSTQENKDKSESITPPTNIGELHHFLLSKSSYALPKISITEDDRISTSGAAVFNGENYEFKGFLDQDETTGRNMIQGTVKTASLELVVHGKQLVYEVKEFNRIIRVHLDDRGLPEFDVEISVRGNIGESELDQGENVRELNGEIKRKAEQRIKQIAMDVILKAQNEYKTDFLGFWKKCQEREYRTWVRYKNDWDRGQSIFSQCKIHVNVDAKVRTVGTVTGTE
ncbi:MAG: Ger(x)C family spore germination protein [Paenibacillus lautus]|jgi:spore germination protein|uniref:Ger(x)C family spore germination protein n=1 Tax=Paenibacillus lautus TaxID=1401 RepID=UPI0026F34F1C|nr:Ger(x)C family spore germination protein [Paenibacillus lautus]MCI1776384.1 Ger(x)C family spore germination protein [Paenibacillus lautus]